MVYKRVIVCVCCLLPVFTFIHAQKVIEGTLTNTHTPPAKAVELYNRGIMFFNKKLFPQAINVYKQAIAADTDYIDAYDNLGLAFYELGRADSAERYFGLSLKKFPSGVTALQNMGMLKENKKEYDKALEYYNQIVKLNPQAPEGYYAVSRILSNTGKYAEALPQALLAEKLYQAANSPYIGDCHYQILIIYFYLNDKPKAKEYLALCKKEGVQVDPILENSLK